MSHFMEHDTEQERLDGAEDEWQSWREQQDSPETVTRADFAAWIYAQDEGPPQQEEP